MEQSVSIAVPGSLEQKRILVDAEEIRFRRRQLVGQFTVGALALLTGFSVAILFIIVGYMLVKGIGGIDLAFFLETPKPHGAGRRRYRAGHCRVAGDDRRRRADLGPAGHRHRDLSGGIWQAAALPARYVSRSNCWPRCLRLWWACFVWALIVRSFTGYSGLAGAVALAVIMVPDYRPQCGRNPAPGAEFAA